MPNDTVLITMGLLIGGLVLIALVGLAAFYIMKSGDKRKSKKSLPSYGADNSTIARDLQDKYRSERRPD